jgi:hypothetical protein
MYMGQAVSGFADIPFAFYWTGFILCGLTRSREGSPARWGLLPLLAVGCTFIKGEGWPAVLIGAGFLALSGPSKHRRSWIGLVLSAAVLLAPWLWARRELPHNAPHYFRLLALPSGEILYRVRLVAGAWLREVSAVRSWGLFWLMALLGVFWPRSRLVFPKESKLILAAVLAQFCVYAYVYLTYRDSLELLLPITLLRLTVHSTGLVIMALGWRLED